MQHVHLKRPVSVFVGGVMSIIALTFFHSGSGEAASPAQNEGQQTNMTESLPEGHRVMEGEIQAIRGRLVEVIMEDEKKESTTVPRFITLDSIQDTDANLRAGDTIKLVVDSENQVVDYFVNSQNTE